MLGSVSWQGNGLYLAVEERINHPWYNPSNRNNDIALLRIPPAVFVPDPNLSISESEEEPGEYLS
jgi:hypothetical protein